MVRAKGVRDFPRSAVRRGAGLRLPVKLDRGGGESGPLFHTETALLIDVSDKSVRGAEEVAEFDIVAVPARVPVVLKDPLLRRHEAGETDNAVRGNAGDLRCGRGFVFRCLFRVRRENGLHGDHGSSLRLQLTLPLKFRDV